MKRSFPYLLVLIALAFQFGCSESEDVVGLNESVIYARVSFSEDVTSIDMQGIGIPNTDLQNQDKVLLPVGQGEIRWTSDGNQYTRSLNIGSQDTEADDSVECEQDGEHEGENEGCTFSFSFSGSTLSIAQIDE